MKSLKPILSLVISISAIPSLAFNVNSVTGKVVAKYPHDKGGLCIIPNQDILTSNELVKVKSGDLEDEAKLCAMSFIPGVNLSVPTGSAELDAALSAPPVMGLKPKLNSTNPGVLVTEADGSTEAKFKQSITCSYAPAALASYHVSRILGNVGRTPVAVARTMDKAQHYQIALGALQALAGDPSQLIYKTWTQFKKAHEQTNLDKKIFDDSGKWVYGALSKNVKKEYKYTVVSGVGAYDTRYQRFMQQSPFNQRVADIRGVLEIAQAEQGGHIDVLKLAPVLVQMKDVSDMVLLDTLLNQDDRIGNIHLKLKWYTRQADGTIVDEKPKDDADNNEIQKIEAKLKTFGSKQHPGNSSEDQLASLSSLRNGEDAIVVREMVLKDNDCGGDVDKRTNQMRANSVLEAVRHMSPDTYSRFMDFAKFAESAEASGEAKAFFRDTVFYRSEDIGSYGSVGKTLMANITKAKQILIKNCNDGKLKLDLDTDIFKTPTTQHGLTKIRNTGC